MTPSTNIIIFHEGPAPAEVIRIDAKGFHYRGQFIEDAGEAHRLLVEFLREHQPEGNWKHAPTEPEPEGPTDDALLELYQGPGTFSAIEYARAVLARWGNHAGSPDSSTPQPVPVSERLPGPGDCNAEGRCWWWYPEVPGKTYGYWAHEDDAVPERALDEQPSYWLPAHALPVPSYD